MHTTIIQRLEAKEAGYVRYFTGVPCMRGHVAERLVTNTRCVQCHKEKVREVRAKSPGRLARNEAAEKAAKSVGKSLISRDEAIAASLKRFFTGKPCNKGHVSERSTSDYACVECSKEKASRERAANPETQRRRVRESYKRNIEVRRQQARDYMNSRYAADPDGFREKQRQRRANDPIFAFNHRARQLVRAALSRSGFRKALKTEAMLGCSLAEFRTHIERQFLPGMGWHNMHLWEIDHITPISAERNQEDAEQLNKASNLRPLWTIENRSKSAKQTHLL